MTVAGVDGCRGGWVCVVIQADPPFSERAFVAETIGEILHHGAQPPAVVAIDIPIGLPERVAGAGRACDIAARKVLGKRAASVFAVPARAVLAAPNYAGACAAALAASDPPRKISKQMFHLFPKIREVDMVMTPEMQTWVFSPSTCSTRGGWACSPIPRARSFACGSPDRTAARRQLTSMAR